MPKLIENHWYKFSDRGDIHIGMYVGREKGYECMVCELMGRPCNFGSNAHGFNIYHSEISDDYESWFYGNKHLPQMIEDLGEYNGSIIVDGKFQK